MLAQESCHDTYSAWEWIGEEVSNPFVDCLRGDTIFEDFELTGDLWWDDLAIFLLSFGVHSFDGGKKKAEAHLTD